MTIRYEKFYTFQMVDSQPNSIFVFGDNMQRVGRGGQAKACRPCLNTLGIVTKRSPYEYFSDQSDEIKALLNDLTQLTQLLVEKADIVLPLDGIGTGRAQLKERSPKIWSFLQCYWELIGAYQFNGSNGDKHD